MKDKFLFQSTRSNEIVASAPEAILSGIAPDGGLFVPAELPHADVRNILSLDPIPMAAAILHIMLPSFSEEQLIQLVTKGYTAKFDTSAITPLCAVNDMNVLELFHGPTLAFKDVGARFMARLLQYFIKKEGGKGEVNVLVATSGDTGSAVANGFLGVDGIHVYVLYPKGKVSAIQECQFTTLGQNITAIEVDGVFDDCQRLVKSAFMDADLNAHMQLTSANSINVARFLPQAFYYFHAYAQLKRMGKADEMVVCVPSGNFGNICAGLFGKRMGLPVKRFIASNNANDIFYKYLQTGHYDPKLECMTCMAKAMPPSVRTSAAPPIPTRRFPLR